MVALKEIGITFKYLEFSDFQSGRKSAVFMLCLDRQDTPASTERVALQCLGKRPGISGLAVAMKVLWR